MQGFQLFIVTRTTMTGEEPSSSKGLWLMASGEQKLPRKPRHHAENMQKAKGHICSLLDDTINDAGG